MPLPFQSLLRVVESASAIVAVNTLLPAGGIQERISPPTFPLHPSRKGPYLTEQHRDPSGEIRDSVVLDTVGSDANWLEAGLRHARDHHGLPLPNPKLDFKGEKELNIAILGTLSALEFPHRIADSNFRFARIEEDGKMVEFWGSKCNRHLLLSAAQRDFSPIFGESPHSLLFGFWDSKSPLGNKGPKVARAIVSEIMGWDAIAGTMGGTRQDPVGIAKVATLEHTPDQGLKILTEAEAAKKLAEKKKNKKEAKDKGLRAPTSNVGDPSEFLLGHIPFPKKDDPHIRGGFTISSATQTIVLNLIEIRTRTFKTDKKGKIFSGKDRLIAEKAAHVYLTVLGLVSIVFARQRGYNLRSRCLLLPTAPMILNVRGPEGDTLLSFNLTPEEALELHQMALDDVKKANLPWNEDGLSLKPTPAILEMIRRSQVKCDAGESEEDGE